MGSTIHYTTAERFTSEFVTALRRSGPEAFKARYRGLDALLIDDVEFLEGKEQTAEEFFHTFNALHAAGKQIVLSSDRPPAALSRLAERLRDRFAWGLSVEIDPPDLRTRIAVLWRLASDRAGELPDPVVLNEIAALVPGNVRVLEGAMTRVLALSSLLREPLSSSIVRQALDAEQGAAPVSSTAHARADPGRRRRRLTASPATSCSPPSALPGSHGPARSPCTWPASSPASRSSEIARAFDRDHTTVLHAIRAVERAARAGIGDQRRRAQGVREPGTLPPRRRRRARRRARRPHRSTGLSRPIPLRQATIIAHPQISTSQIHLNQVGR